MVIRPLLSRCSRAAPSSACQLSGSDSQVARQLAEVLCRPGTGVRLSARPIVMNLKDRGIVLWEEVLDIQVSEILLLDVLVFDVEVLDVEVLDVLICRGHVIRVVVATIKSPW